MKKIKIGKVFVDNVTLGESINYTKEVIDANKKSFIVTPNVDHIVKLESDYEFIKCYKEAGLVLADGMPLVWFSKILKTPLKEKVSGSDLFPELCKLSSQYGYKVFFLGGLEGVAAKAAYNLKRSLHTIDIVGIYSPPFGFEKDINENKKIIEMINSVKPNILFVGVGAPKQEKWIYNHINDLDVNVAIGIGASFDFIAGTITRAPKAVQRLGMEWFWRFSHEPRRLFKRYFIDGSKFFPIVFKQLFSKN